MSETRVLYQNEVPTPLGTVRVVAEQRNTRGLGPGRMRVFGAYAVVLLHNGSGRYVDRDHEFELSEGSAIVVLPDIPHTYISRRRQGWTETYATFDGPAFDLLRETGVLRRDPLVVSTPLGWRQRFEEFSQASPGDAPARLRHIGRLVDLLIDLMADITPAAEPEGWVPAAKAALETDLDQELDLARIAGQLGLSEQAFRKRFARMAGISPVRYRSDRRIAAAANLLRQTTMTHRQIAENLGYVDEFHLSKRFKAAMGVSPRDYRLG